jgi:hypothetical protein
VSAARAWTFASDHQALARSVAGLRLPERTRALLGQAALGSSASDRASTQAASVLRRLVALLVLGEKDAKAYRPVVSSLVGLGPGLTPTGDDFLIALVVSGRRLCALGLLSNAALSALGTAIAAVPAGRTTERAEQMLREACGGGGPAPLAAFVEAFGDSNANDEHLQRLVDELAAIGAHSGCDWLAAVVALVRPLAQRAPGAGSKALPAAVKKTAMADAARSMRVVSSSRRKPGPRVGGGDTRLLWPMAKSRDLPTALDPGFRRGDVSARNRRVAVEQSPCDTAVEEPNRE